MIERSKRLVESARRRSTVLFTADIHGACRLMPMLLVLGFLVLAGNASAQDHYSDLEFPPLRDFALPQVKRFVLENQMVLFVVEDHALPKVEGQMFVRAGTILEPVDKLGLATILAQVIANGGSQMYDGKEVDELVGGLGTSIEAEALRTRMEFSFFSLQEDYREILEVLADLVQRPRLPADKTDLAKVREAAGIERQNDNAAGIARREFTKLLYGADNPWGRQATLATVDSITPDDLTAFHEQWFLPNRTILGVWGDCQAEEVRDLVEKAFGSWRQRDTVEPELPTLPANSPGRVQLVDRQDVNQSTVYIGHQGGRLDDQDYCAMIVATEILGGGFKSRLFRQVRSNLGLAYSVRATWRASYEYPGYFAAFVQTKSESTVRAVEEIVAQARQLTRQPVTESELILAKESLLNSFVFEIGGPGEIVSRVMTYELYGYPANFLELYKHGIEKVQVEDILQAAQRNIRPDEFIVLIVGNASEIDEPLDTLGPAPGLD